MFPVPPPNFQRLNTNAREQFLHDITNNNHGQNVHPNNNNNNINMETHNFIAQGVRELPVVQV